MANDYTFTDNFGLQKYGDKTPADFRDGHNNNMDKIDLQLKNNNDASKNTQNLLAAIGVTNTDSATALKHNIDALNANLTALNANLTALGANNVTDANNLKNTISKNTQDIAATMARTQRNFIIFGDSWTTPLADNINIVTTAISRIPYATIIKNYGVAGALIGTPAQVGNNCTENQFDTAKHDSTVDKKSITDVLILAGVNNIGSAYAPNEQQARENFTSIKATYPNARFWYVMNAKKCITSDTLTNVYNTYLIFQKAAKQAGYLTANYSPIWQFNDTISNMWAEGTVPGTRHMSAYGQTRWSNFLAEFLKGNEPIPIKKIPVTTVPGFTTNAETNLQVLISGNIITINGAIAITEHLSDPGEINFLTIEQSYAPIRELYGVAFNHLDIQSHPQNTNAQRLCLRPTGTIATDSKIFETQLGYITLFLTGQLY